MDNDDRQVGTVLTRRDALAVLGSAGALMLTGFGPAGGGTRGARAQQQAGCVVRPRQTEGPYFVDELLNRSDIRSDPGNSGAVRPGVPLQLGFNVSRLAAGTCAPLVGALVDVWQCDHLGVYSDVQDPGFNSRGQKFLRGYQLTDAAGHVRFTTIYPGWYQGRTVHIHFKIRSAPNTRPGYEFTSQLYFDDAMTDRVFELAPYADRCRRSTRNANDRIFRRESGTQLILAVAGDAQGYAGTFDVALQAA